MAELLIEGLTVRFGGVSAVRELDLRVAAGSVTALIGPNGAGKTTVLNAVSRIVQPAAGRIAYDGRDLLRLHAADVIGTGVARSFQNVALFPELSVIENLRIGSDFRSREGMLKCVFGAAGLRRHERVETEHAWQILGHLQLTEVAHVAAGDLPYGHQKLVDIGRALMARPQLVLLDEPAAGMMRAEKERLGGLIRQLPNAFGTTVLVIDHDVRLIFDIACHVLVMNHGQKIAEGRPAEVRANPEVITAYLGSSHA